MPRYSEIWLLTGRWSVCLLSLSFTTRIIVIVNEEFFDYGKYNEKLSICFEFLF